MSGATLSFTVLPFTNGLSSTAATFDMHTTLAQPQTVEQPSFIQPGVEIEMPDFDSLFDRIQEVSPLAKAAIDELTPEESKKVFNEADCK